jgi:probable F420-dependent oxidoreductase
MTVQFGVVFPQTEIGADPGAIREYVQAAEELGYSYIFMADHVLGADPQHHQHVDNSYYTHRSVIHEQLVTLGFISAVTKNVGLVTGILILPQRQTALVAKQAAEIDLLSGGRLKLGIGVGWNHVEYEALGQDFHNRGRRCEEQIQVLRALWTQEVVNFKGRWHRITHAGINPLPAQQPIPIWLGAGGSGNPIPVEPVMRRIAVLSDGWFPSFLPNDAGREAVDQIRAYAQEAGRDPSEIGMMGRLRLPGKQPEDWLNEVKAWEEMGATHLLVEARRGVLSSVDGHIDAIKEAKEVMGV